MDAGGRDDRLPRRARFVRRTLSLTLAAAMVAALAALVASLGRAPRPVIHPPAKRSVSALDAVEAERASWIVFAGNRDGRYHIQVIHPDGSGERSLTSGAQDDKTPAWSPRRDRIAFVRTVGASGTRGRRTHIFVMNADGTGLRAVTSGGGLEEDPSWAPDGTRLALASRDVRTGFARIGVVGIDGGRVTEVSTPPRRCSDQEPAWSPDGASIAFVRQCVGGSSALFVMRADGTATRLLTAFGRTPSWSPDGARIAYTGMASYGAAIFIIHANGTGRVQLTTESSGDPVWSPDGRRIAFTQNAMSALRLFVIDLDGSGLRPVNAEPANEVEPSW